jgi:predicted permease
MKRTVNFNPNLIPAITGLMLAVSCEWDFEKILEIAADALTDANGHTEAKQLREILERIRREG